MSRHGVRQTRLANAHRPRLTAGEVSLRRHKKTATPWVGGCGRECLQTIKTRHTVSRIYNITLGRSCQADQALSVRIDVYTPIDTYRRTPYTGAARL